MGRRRTGTRYIIPINVNPLGGGGVRARGGDLTNFEFFGSNSPGWETKGRPKVSKKPPPQGKNLNKQYYNTIYIKLKEYFKSMFLLLLFMVNVSSVKLLAVIKYFLFPLASPILNNKITPGTD